MIFSCIILAFFLRCRPLSPVQKIMAVNFFRWVGGGGHPHKKICSHSQKQQKARLIKGSKKKNKDSLVDFIVRRCHPARKFIYFNWDCECSGALGVIVEAHMCVCMCVSIREGVSV